MTFLSNPVTTPFIIIASVWLGDWLFGLHANSATFSAMIEHGASAGEWVRWVFSDAAPAMLAGAVRHFGRFGGRRLHPRLDFLG